MPTVFYSWPFHEPLVLAKNPINSRKFGIRDQDHAIRGNTLRYGYTLANLIYVYDAKHYDVQHACMIRRYGGRYVK